MPRRNLARGVVDCYGTSGILDVVSIAQEYFSILFLSETRAFYRVLSEIENHRDDLHELFDTLGEIDALQAIASCRDWPPYYGRRLCYSALIDVDDMFHHCCGRLFPIRSRL